jgi:hypothetical protein
MNQKQVFTGALGTAAAMFLLFVRPAYWISYVDAEVASILGDPDARGDLGFATVGQIQEGEIMMDGNIYQVTPATDIWIASLGSVLLLTVFLVLVFSD